MKFKKIKYIIWKNTQLKAIIGGILSHAKVLDLKRLYVNQLPPKED